MHLADLRVRNVVAMRQMGYLTDDYSIMLPRVEDSVCVRVQEHDVCQAVFHSIVSFALGNVKYVQLDQLIKAPNSNGSISRSRNKGVA